MFAFENEAAINLVAQYHDVAIADGARDRLDILLLQHATGRVLRRVQNDELCAIVNETGQLIDVQPEIQFLAQPDRHRLRADVVDH